MSLTNLTPIHSCGRPKPKPMLQNTPNFFGRALPPTMHGSGGMRGRKEDACQLSLTFWAPHSSLGQRYRVSNTPNTRNYCVKTIDVGSVVPCFYARKIAQGLFCSFWH